MNVSEKEGREDTKMLRILESEVEPDKEGVVEASEDFLLSAHVLHLLLTNNVSLVQNFH